MASFTTTVSAAITSPTGHSVSNAPTNGITGGYQGDNRTILRAMTAFAAIAWYNAIELIILSFLRFKKKTGLYFWSMFITSFFIIVYQIGAWGKMVEITTDKYQLVTVTFLNVGWIFMVVGQSIVLYSRLHLICQRPRILKSVLWMIIINSTLMYIPTTTLTYGANVQTTLSYIRGYNIMERVQMTAFTIQELIISGIYLWEASNFLRVAWEGQTRKLMWELLFVNIALIILDAALLSVEYVDLYEIETTLKGMVYSIKLKLELGVLSKLVKLVTDRRESYKIVNPEQAFDIRRCASAQVAKHTLDSPGSTPPSDCHVDDASSAHKDREVKHIDFGALNGGAPLTGPSVECNAHVNVVMPQMARRPSRRSSICDLYPGKLG